jgi:hypothetical protein
MRHQRVFEQAPPASLVKGPHFDRYHDETTTNLQESFNHSAHSPFGLFLDSQIFQEYYVEIPKARLPVPLSVRSIIGETYQQHAIAKSFFETIHEWMPIISKKQLYKNLNPICLPGADYALLLLSMDLISWLPSSQDQDPRTSTYLTAKKYFLDLEIAGVVSVQILQAGILIAIFELGHAIYPSAFLSVAHCARYASALGIGWRKASSGEILSGHLDLEERNRSWWAIVLLDRYDFHHCVLYNYVPTYFFGRIINVGRTEQPLLIPHPGIDVILPGSDTDWEYGVSDKLTFPPQSADVYSNRIRKCYIVWQHQLSSGEIWALSL